MHFKIPEALNAHPRHHNTDMTNRGDNSQASPPQRNAMLILLHLSLPKKDLLMAASPPATVQAVLEGSTIVQVLRVQQVCLK
jgi:hypothetical protein